MTERKRWAGFWEYSGVGGGGADMENPNKYGYPMELIRWLSNHYQQFRSWNVEIKIGAPHYLDGKFGKNVKVGAIKEVWEQAKQEFELAETKENYEQGIKSNLL
jgi:hypothetical protein